MTTDRGQLTLVAEQVQDTVCKKDITIIADKGYFSRIDIKATQDLGMTVNIPQIDISGAAKKGIFNKSLFKCDKDQGIYICPAGEELPHRRDVTERGLELKVYVNHIACRDCTIRHKCTTSSKEPRKMKRKNNVSIEMNLHVLAYNLNRMMTIMGTTGLMEAIRQ